MSSLAGKYSLLSVRSTLVNSYVCLVYDFPHAFVMRRLGPCGLMGNMTDSETLPSNEEAILFHKFQLLPVTSYKRAFHCKGLKALRRSYTISRNGESERITRIYETKPDLPLIRH